LAAIAIALFEWNWLRGPFAAYMSARLDRPVTIDGNFHVALSFEPLVTADYVTIGNSRWSTEPVMARAQRVAFRIELATIFKRPVALPEVHLAQPRLLLERSADGHANWEFEGPAEVPLIGRLNIEDGVLHYLNPGGATDVTVSVQSSASAENGEMPVRFSGSGRLRNNAFTIEGTAASLLLLEEQNRPYRLDVKARAAIPALISTVPWSQPVDTVDGSLVLQGRDLSQLYPIILVPFPWTPRYRFTGKLKHDNTVWSYREFRGVVGDSDLAGNFSVDRSTPRPRVDAELVSERLHYKDLGGLIGLPPTNEPPSARSAAQNKEAAKRERTDRVLPTRPYDLERLRAIDANVRLSGKHFVTTDLPLDNMRTTLDLQDGVSSCGRWISVWPQMSPEQGTRAKVIKASGDVIVAMSSSGDPLRSNRRREARAKWVGARFAATDRGHAGDEQWRNRADQPGGGSELKTVLTNLDLANARAAAIARRPEFAYPLRCRRLRRGERRHVRYNVDHGHRSRENSGLRHRRFRQ
jgi:uncharacterized protein involved in outer membrane biogenesis